MSPRKPPDPSHPDEVTGALSGILQFLAAPTRNTLADLDVYRGLPLEALFPAPSATPDARVTTRWRIPGAVSEDIVFPSQHEPIEPGFRQRYLTEYPEIHTVYARRIRPAGLHGRPRLVYLHGYLQPETYVEETALLMSMAPHAVRASAGSSTGPRTWSEASKPCGRIYSTRVRCSVGCRPRTRDRSASWGSVSAAR
jgi:hypothetical protein